jgi:hypothetical protein
MFIVYFVVYSVINLCNFAYIYTRPATTRVRGPPHIHTRAGVCVCITCGSPKPPPNLTHTRA